MVEGASEVEGAAPELSRSLMKRLWLGSGLRPSGGTDSSQAPRVVQLLGRDTCHAYTFRKRGASTDMFPNQVARLRALAAAGGGRPASGGGGLSEAEALAMAEEVSSDQLRAV